MLYPIKVTDIELSKPVENISGLNGYLGLQGLVRLYGIPIGYINLPVTNGMVEASAINKEVLEKHSTTLIYRLLENGLSALVKPKQLHIHNLFEIQPDKPTKNMPMMSVAVCTRDRRDDLALCLEALSKLDYTNLEVIVVDNAPATKDTELLVKNHYPAVRYIQEPRPGLDWARNRAIVEARGEIIAFTDDDVVVDAGWVSALAAVFEENQEVMAVTGLVVPYELETEAQVLFEKYGGFGKGFQRKWNCVEPGKKMHWQLLNTGQFGTGANMSFRCSLFDRIGYFDPALDVGTVTNGGGDLEMFFRTLKGGYMLVYEPRAIVRHRHRREYQQLKLQLTNNGSLITYLVCGAISNPEGSFAFFKLGIAWIRNRYMWRFIQSLSNPKTFPCELVLAEILGGTRGLFCYHKACKIAKEIEANFGSNVPEVKKTPYIKLPALFQTYKGIRTIELSEAIHSLNDVTSFSSVLFHITWRGNTVGDLEISNKYQNISSKRLIEEIVNALASRILSFDNLFIQNNTWLNAKHFLSEHYPFIDRQMIDL